MRQTEEIKRPQRWQDVETKRKITEVRKKTKDLGKEMKGKERRGMKSRGNK